LKELLTSAPILRVAYLDEDFIVCTNACKEGISGLLTQNGHVVCYDSRKLKENEMTYSTHELDLETIIHALKIWRHYVMVKKFELRTKHSGLEYLFE